MPPLIIFFVGMKIGLLGTGTVGGGVVNVLTNNYRTIVQSAQEDIEIVIVAVKDKNEPRICEIDTHLLTEDAFEVVNHPEVEVVLELIGGTDLARDLVKTALKNRKHVITANKALIATYGNELLQFAQENRVVLLFEAAVAGGIPIIKSIIQGLSANKIQMVAGIINGTSNFILSEMTKKKRNFADVLAEAQRLGYAEADPTYDVEGIDAAHKLAILSTLSFRHRLALDKVMVQGISQIEPADIVFADELGYVIKHLGIAKQTTNGVEMRTHPTLIPKSTLLGQIDGVMNAVFIQSNALGDSLYYGAGAGSDATASAVIADLIDLINQTHIRVDLSQFSSVNYVGEAETQSTYYLRLLVGDTPGVLANISQTLSAQNISIETVIQHPQDHYARIAIITNAITAKALQNAVAEIEVAAFNQQAIQCIRIEELN